jgi:hypothetical protein
MFSADAAAVVERDADVVRNVDEAWVGDVVAGVI